MGYGNTYKGKYKIKKPEKYIGDVSSVTYRSMWERCCFVWAERNPDVVKWSSEEVVIPYIDANTGKARRYFIDLQLEMKSGKKYLIEVKPHKQTKPPSKRGKKKAKLIEEQATYVTNMSKWSAAAKWAKSKGFEFVVWDEHTLKDLGILKV